MPHARPHGRRRRASPEPGGPVRSGQRARPSFLRPGEDSGSVLRLFACDTQRTSIRCCVCAPQASPPPASVPPCGVHPNRAHKSRAHVCPDSFRAVAWASCGARLGSVAGTVRGFDCTEVSHLDIWTWIQHWDYGSVPAWASALSLFLAFVIFRRDRRERITKQVDQVGIWCAKLNYKPDDDPGDNKGPFDIVINIKNASDLPIVVDEVEYNVELGPADGFEWTFARTFNLRDAKVGLSRRIRDGVIGPGESHSSPATLTRRNSGALYDELSKRSRQWKFSRLIVTSALVRDSRGRIWQIYPAGPRRPRRIKEWRRVIRAVVIILFGSVVLKRAVEALRKSIESGESPRNEKR